LEATNDLRNAASLAKVSKEIRPSRSSPTTGFKGNVSGKFTQGRTDAETEDATKFKKDAINTGRFLSKAQTVMDKGYIFPPWAQKLKRREVSLAAIRGSTISSWHRSSPAKRF
jgi:hypothetical protein